jgi:fungal STAND N-terminal Goodbye domain
MAVQSGYARFQALFESALQAYEETTGIALAQHPLAVNLQCHSIDDTTTLLQGRAQAFSDSRQRDRIMRAIKNTVSILNLLSDVVVLVRQGYCRRVPHF